MLTNRSTLVNRRGAERFIGRYGTDVQAVYNAIQNTGMESDLLRYLILHAEGGVYSDIDTIALKAIATWVPEELQDQVGLIVGIESDRLEGDAWADIPHWVQFCQWTIASTPGHPILDDMVREALLSVHGLSALHGLPLEELAPTYFEVLNSAGPAA